MKTLAPLPLLFALALCFSTTSCKSIGGDSLFGEEKSPRPPVVAPGPVEDFAPEIEKTPVYYIKGEINDPGMKRMTGRTSFTQAIAAAGGATDFAHRKRVYVKRGSEQYEVDRIEIEEDPALDFEIFSGDVITLGAGGIY